MGKEQPVASMDARGKIIWARHNEIQMVDVKKATGEYTDGERLPLVVKELGNCEVNFFICNSEARPTAERFTCVQVVTLGC
jgi:hypothetical protein